MSEGPATTARRVLWEHQRVEIGSCLCGWGVATGDLGRDHGEHVIDQMRAEGLHIVRRQEAAQVAELPECPTEGMCPNCREGVGHWADGEWLPTVESTRKAAVCTCWLREDVRSPMHDPRHCPMYGDRP